MRDLRLLLLRTMALRSVALILALALPGREQPRSPLTGGLAARY